MNRRHILLPVTAVGLGALLLTGCEPNNPSDASGSDRIAVTSSEKECQVATTEAPAGTIRFTVENTGSQVTEFYLLGEDGLRIIGEVENIGPGLSRDLTVTAPEGKYFTACKPGMVGDGIRGDFTVTKAEGGGAEVSADDQKLKDEATAQYSSYVKDQTEQLMTGTEDFAEKYKAGDDDAARKLYAAVRMHWERIEPVAESFGDLDPQLDAREADLEEGQEWTGWHRIEKDLWPPKKGAEGTGADAAGGSDSGDYQPMSDEQRTQIADKLVADTKTLYDRTRSMDFTADQLSNGAKELLDEVATGKVTGEEEFWSHTDLWDFQANVDGARITYENLKPLLDKRDKDLSEKLTVRFDKLQTLLDQHKKGEGFKLYTELSKDEVKELSDAVNALSEPLSQVTEKVIE